MNADRPACPRCPCPGACLGTELYCSWAARESPDPLTLRHICDASRMARARGEGPAYPSPSRQGANLARALWDWAVGGFGMASDQEVARRLAICAGCDRWDADSGRCRICGCFLPAKVRLRTEHCPLPEPRW